MLVKTIKYEDYNGVEREEEFLFNMTKTEVFQWENGVDGGMQAILDRIVKEKRVPELIKYFQEIIDKSYGVKSPDGRRFIKDEQALKDFQGSPAYDILYMELVTDTEKAVDFIKGIMPKDLAASINTKEIAKTAGVHLPG